MRRPSGIALAGALLVLSLFSSHGLVRAASLAPVPGQQPAPAAPTKVTFTGDTVLWAFTVNPDKTADYDQVLEKLKAALQKIERPEAKQQLAGWKVIKNAMPQTDGSILYIHVISPVVKDADYSITNLYYEAFTDPAERKVFYDMYRGALKAALFTIQGPVVADLSK
jgi:hypothetical protein